MVDANIQSQRIACLKTLDPAQQRQVLNYALNLRAKTLTGVPGRHFLRIDEADLNAMSSAIAAGCERIDTDGW